MSMVDVTDVKVVPIRGEGSTRAMASVTIANAFTVHGLRVVEGEKGLFVAMPQRKGPDGQYRDLAHPVTADMRTLVSHAVLEGYEKAIERGERPKEVAPKGRSRG